MSYSLTEKDLSLITEISKNIIVNDLFQKLDEQKEHVFQIFKEKTIDEYSNKEFNKKKEKFDNLDISIFYFNYKYDVINMNPGTSYWSYEFKKNDEYFKKPQALKWTFEELTVRGIGTNWKMDNYEDIIPFAFISLGKMNLNMDAKEAKDWYWEGIKVNTKFE